MGVYKTSVITDAGNAILTRAVAGKTKIQFTKSCISSYQYPDGTNLAGLTELNEVQQETTPTSVWVAGEKKVGVRVMFGNEGVSLPYAIQNIGLYASDEEGEVLFSVTQAINPDLMPVYSETTPSSFIYNIQILVSQAEVISAEVDPAGTVTVQDLLDVRESLGKLYRTVTVPVPVAWTETAPYTQEVAVSGLKVGDPAEIWSAVTEDTAVADAKIWDKMASMISYAKIQEDGTLTLACLNKKPTAAFRIRVKGVSV